MHLRWIVIMSNNCRACSVPDRELISNYLFDFTIVQQTIKVQDHEFGSMVRITRTLTSNGLTWMGADFLAGQNSCLYRQVLQIYMNIQ